MGFSDDEDREVAAASQTPYLNAVLRGPAPASKPALRSITVQPPRDEGGHCKSPRWHGRRPPFPPPPRRSRRGTHRHETTKMVIGLRRYDHPRAAFAPCVDPDGWQRVQRRCVSSRVERAPQPEAPVQRCFPKELDGQCLNCLSFKH
jgi:hypothetical protein